MSLLDISRRFRASSSVVLLSDGPFRELLTAEGIRTELIEAGSGLLSVRRSGAGVSLAALGEALKLIGSLARLARKSDLLYANSQKAFVLSAVCAPLARRPLIWHLRDILTEAHFSRSNIRLVVALANLCASRVIANSQATAHAFVAAGGKATKVQVIHNGIDPQPFSTVDQGAARALRCELGIGDAALIGIFGRFHPWKGQHVAVDVMSQIPDAHAVFVGDALFGESTYVAEIRRKVREAGIAHRVHFLGFRRDLPRLLRAVDIVLHTAEAPEPFGRIIVEAMFAERPVIAAAAGGVPEIVVQAVTGYLVAPGDVGEFVKALRLLLSDPARREAMGRAGKDRAHGNFTLDIMLPKLESTILAVTNER